MSTKDLQDSSERKSETWIICGYCWSAWSVHHIGERCDCGEYLWPSEDEDNPMSGCSIPFSLDGECFGPLKVEMLGTLSIKPGDALKQVDEGGEA